MIVYRLTKLKYKSELSGIGAELHGGRWNSKGKRVIYTSQSRALSTTEIAVHTPLGIVPIDYFLQTIKLPSAKMVEIDEAELDSKWKSFPHHRSTKKIGDKFIEENKLLILKTPSAVIQGDYNFLINPNHKSFSKVELIGVEKYEFDKRLFLR